MLLWLESIFVFFSLVRYPWFDLIDTKILVLSNHNVLNQLLSQFSLIGYLVWCFFCLIQSYHIFSLIKCNQVWSNNFVTWVLSCKLDQLLVQSNCANFNWRLKLFNVMIFRIIFQGHIGISWVKHFFAQFPTHNINVNASKISIHMRLLPIYMWWY